MVKKLINNKIFKFSSITTISSLNICAGNWRIINGSINIEGCNSINISGSTYKSFHKMNNYNDFCNYLSELFDFQNNISKKTIKEEYGDFNKYILTYVNNIDLRSNYFSNILPVDILNSIASSKQLHITLIKKPCVRIAYDSFNYRYKDDFSKKIDDINKDIVNLKSLTIGDFKKKLTDKLIDLTKFNIKYVFSSYVVNDDVDFVTNPIFLEYKGGYTDYFEPCKTEIEFIAGDGLELDESFKKDDEIVFVKEKILQNMPIKNYIFYKYKGLNDSNCTIEYKDKRGFPDYGPCGDNYVFFDGQNLKITINSEITGVSKKKAPEKYNIDVNFEVKDPSKYVFKEEINNINSLEVEEGKDFDYLIGEINKHLKKELNIGFKIYKNTKDPKNEFTTGLLENNVTYIVVFEETALGFVKEKDKDKIYINLKFDVEDNSNFKLKQGINDINGIKVEQGKNYNDLLNIIKDKLGNKELKEGFKIYKNDKNNEFTTGILEDKITYIVVFVNDDSNFVEEKPKPKPKPQTPQKPGPQEPKPQKPGPQEQDPPKTQETTNTEQNNNDDNKTTKKGGCSGKNKKKCC